MRRLAALAGLAVLPLAASPAFAVPDAQEIRLFNLEIEKERSDFEKKMSAPLKGPRTLAIESFEKKRREDTANFQNQIEHLTLEGRRAAISEYQEKLRVERAAHLEKLKKMPFEPNNAQKQRKEFDRKMADKIRKFYSEE